MKIEILSQPTTKSDLIRFVVKGAAKISGVAAAEFDGAKNSTCLVRVGSQRQLHVGLGEAAKITSEVLRQASGVATKSLLKIGAETIAIEAAEYLTHLHPIVEGSLLAGYKFETFLMPENRRKNVWKNLQIIVPTNETSSARTTAKRAEIYAHAVNTVREIGNLPGNVITPATLAQRAQKLAKEAGLTCKVWNEAALKKDGFGGILAVGQGSANEPRFITLEYRGAKNKSARPYALVGKAITFDSGGISLKPGDRMDEMKFDKMGGVAVLGIMQAVSALKLPINVVALIASAENMPSDRAYRPGDIVTTYGGKTIEVLNTDAEGRIVLADALAYAEKHFQPALMFDFATLTGACVVALGPQRAGMFTMDEKLRNEVWALSAEAGDRVWPLPFGEEFDEMVKSDVALVKNTGGREGGACSAASFLKAWVEKTPWMHIDLAGPAWLTKELPHLEKGATGFGVRLIVEFLRRRSPSS